MNVLVLEVACGAGVIGEGGGGWGGEKMNERLLSLPFPDYACYTGYFGNDVPDILSYILLCCVLNFILVFTII